jgi:hypothetical protein
MFQRRLFVGCERDKVCRADDGYIPIRFQEQQVTRIAGDNMSGFADHGALDYLVVVGIGFYHFQLASDSDDAREAFDIFYERVSLLRRAFKLVHQLFPELVQYLGAGD